MGSFANSIFSVMLGWIRGAVSSLWTILTSEESGGVLTFLADHWLTLAIAVCVAGVVIDFVVYMIRWRPYKVWASFFRRLRGKGAEEPDEQPRPRPRAARRPDSVRAAAPAPGTFTREWRYPDGTARTEEVWPDGEKQFSAPYAPAELPPAPEAFPGRNSASAALPEQYVMKFARPEAQTPPPQPAPEPVWTPRGRAYRRPEELRYQQDAAPAPAVQMTGLEDYPQPRAALPETQALTPEPPAEPEPVARQPLYRAKRIPLPRNFGMMDDDELQLRYQPAPPAVDKSKAYHEPVYPPSWKPPADADRPAAGGRK